MVVVFFPHFVLLSRKCLIIFPSGCALSEEYCISKHETGLFFSVYSNVACDLLILLH